MTPERLKELTKLTNSKFYSDRLKAAQALDLPLELQEILVRDKYEDVRYFLAENPSVTDIQVQQILARDEDWTVRCHLARNKSVTNVEVQEILARDKDENVCYWLARNKSVTDRNLCEILRNDECLSVREAINKRINQEKDRIKQEFKEKIKK